MTPSRRTIVWWMLAGINLAAILNVTLYPTPRGAVAAAATPLLCVVCGPRGGVDVFLNVLMLVPLGVCLRLSGLSWGRVTLACGLLSLGIESLQYFVIPGRDAGLGDVLSNTTGGALGAAIAPHLKTMLSPGRRMATRLLRIGVAVWLGLALLSAWLFLPWRESAPAFSERSDQSGLPDAFAGGLGRVLLSGDSVPTGILDEKHSEWIRQVFASEHIGLRMEVVSSTPLRDSAWLYRVRIGPGILSIGQQGRALILEVPRRAAALRFAGPTIRLERGAPTTAGVPFTVAAGEEGPHVWIESTIAGHTRRADLVLTPTMAWATVVPFDYAMGGEAPLLSFLWVGWLIFPLGYWAADSGRPVIALRALVVAVAGGLGLIPWLVGTGPAPAPDWVAAVAGAAAGWAARRSATYLASRCGFPSASESSSS